MTLCVFIRSTTFHNKSGGLETQNQVLCEGLVKEGHKVFVVTTGLASDRKDQTEIGHCPNYIFTESPPGKYSKKWFKESVRAYIELSCQHKIDVLVSQSSAGLEVFKKVKNVKKIAISHGTSFGEWQTRFKILKSPKNFVRLIIKDTPMALSGWWEDYQLFKLSDRVVCVSSLVKVRIEREFPMFREKFVTIDNGVDTNKFRIKNEELGTKLRIKNPFTLLYIGRVVKEKGLEVLLTAVSELKRLTKLKLLIVGAGADLESLKVLAKSQGLPVNFIGEVSNHETVKYYHKANAFAFPTLRQEGFPMVLAEAMAAGLPIIASRIGGIPSAITDGENGILVAPGSVAELSKAIEMLYKDEEHRVTLATNAQKLSGEKYSQKCMIKKYLELVAT
ncbi:hypothetical protein COT49_01060 [candidate division WWE3 bacterium CG08_land_8_20_14_0_20_40_13]|uniref:Glycosyltransferase family 1 protein n=1 Tax=candidate division WWE3 bacterium CG08_land_8_20_14_0_20_40_13 TaxID=1975084 RepID=A0A2H0XE98_UNCKA|nr:MAG: hypothetical protein COT49_01060 [candidate division WWE3 bacterium CG08_land_8_20_14_0_20_40_13]